MSRDRIKDNILFDYYGMLLTEHQNDILDEYFNEDLSMNEIAANYDISKSAVQDLIKRSLKQLEEYEKKLHLVKQNEELSALIKKMKDENNIVLNKYIKLIENIIK